MTVNWLSMHTLIVLTVVLTAAVSHADGDGLSQSSERRAFKMNVRTEDADLNRSLDSIYDDCFAGRLRDPAPPCLPYKYFAPGGGYPDCQTLWDTMFIANFYAPWGDPDVLKGLFSAFFSAIDNNPEAPKGSYRYGMVPCSLYKKRESQFMHFPFSQIPILAWGCFMVYNQTGDRDFLESALPYLISFDRWYSSERDVDGDGLIEYGSYRLDEMVAAAGQDNVQSARYETFDWHSTLDNMKLTKHPKRADSGEWYGNAEGVDQTCFLLMSERAIMAMAEVLGKDDLAVRYERIINRRVAAIRKKMWNPETGFFHSLDRDSDKQIPDRTIQGFLALTAGAATKQQAKVLVANLKDPGKFWCAYPVPTQAMDDPKYSPAGVWRGDVWPPMNYLVAYGLNQYGYYEEAQELTRRTVELTTRGGTAINERYNGVTGDPIGGPGLQMSCATGLMIVQNTYGIGPDFRMITVLPGSAGCRLVWGELEVFYPDELTVEVRSGFNRDMQVVFPGAGKKASLSVICKSEDTPPEGLKTDGKSVSFSADAGKVYRIHLDSL
ncbi:MAG: amylo-alpha-1,6-glucosidase [Armatimonadota bacterium]